uniref:Nischarin n=1 Tax=Sander lucioperca TaxID=283035 RepID=A0A8C9ZVN4_SANLU
MLGKNSKSLVERRQKELELYLQTLLLQFPQATPTPLACFLHFHLYEINGITAALAEELFHKGEQLLQAGEVFSLQPLQLYSVSQQLRLAKPTCCNGDAKTDLGHILDFTCRLRYLKMSGTRGPVGTSNIQESSLPFDLSVFKSLLQIEISECSSQQIGGLSFLRSSLETLSIHHSTETMMSILVPEASEFSQWEAEGAESGCPVTAVIPLWRNLTTLDMSHNGISTIDSSVKLIPKVEFLDLSHNQLSTVENLQHLYNLVHVDLSYNSLRVLEAAHTRLGNIKTLSLAGNQLEQLTGLTKLYSLVNLDLSHNQLAQLEEIKNIGLLPCLEKLNLSSNPMCIIPDYRTKVLAQFGDRAAEVCLDGTLTTEKELDTVEVLKAIQKAKEVKDKMSSGDKKVRSVVPNHPAGGSIKPACMVKLSVFMSVILTYNLMLSLLFALFFSFFAPKYCYYLYVNHHVVSRRSHTVELLLGGQRLLLLFPLAQNRSSFLGELSQRRASLEGLKMIALPQPCRPCPQQGEDRLPAYALRSRREFSSGLISEKTHFVPSLFKFQLHLFPFLCQSEVEEVRQVLWLSVVLYKSPESELTCCLLLSTDTIYFLLEDSASTLGHHSDPDVCLCCCLSIRLSDLLSVNVGLFDQYFRVVGRSADHIVCCLSRDSYGTGVFLQELMSALSLQQQLPPPEPSDQDFYSQFTNTNMGKMQNYELVHSSRVKFIYPSEEEMGDLTFIVAERKTPASAASTPSRSFNVLLYLLVFQVSHSSSVSGSSPSPVLQPRTLILTSTDVFLLDEDYVSYPLPDFAKEPPSRERYQLREARRIRDLDRVLLGYQTYPQALTLVFDDLPGPDLLCHLTMDHFAAAGEEAPPRGSGASCGAEGEVQWCVFVPGADSRERLISLLARQWEALCSRELPVELTG